MVLNKEDGSYDLRSKGSKHARARDKGGGLLVTFIYIPLGFVSLTHIAIFLEAYSNGIGSYFGLFTSGESPEMYWITLVGLIINLFLVYKFFNLALTGFIFAGAIWVGYGYLVKLWLQL